MTSTKVWHVVDVPLHIRLAAQKVDVEEELQRVRAENKRKYDEPPIGECKRARHSSYSSPPWRKGHDNSWGNHGSWGSNAWKGNDKSWEGNDKSWKENDSSWRGWSWANSGKRSRHW